MAMTYYELERAIDAARQLRAETLGKWVSAFAGVIRAPRRPVRLLPTIGTRKA